MPTGAVAPARRGPFVGVLALLVVAGVVGLLLLNTAMQRRAFALTELSDRADALDVRAAALAMRADRPASPQHLARAATRLGMVRSPRPVFLDLANGRVVGTPVPATTANSIPGMLPPVPELPEPRRKPADPASVGEQHRSAARGGE